MRLVYSLCPNTELQILRVMGVCNVELPVLSMAKVGGIGLIVCHWPEKQRSRMELGGFSVNQGDSALGMLCTYTTQIPAQPCPGVRPPRLNN